MSFEFSEGWEKLKKRERGAKGVFRREPLGCRRRRRRRPVSAQQLKKDSLPLLLQKLQALSAFLFRSVQATAK